MPIRFKEVTWYSRFLTYFLIFGGFPALVFYVGQQYYKTIESLSYGYVVATDMHMNGDIQYQTAKSLGSGKVENTLIGEWVSSEDTDYQMLLKKNNLYMDVYGASINSTGAWLIKDSLPETLYADMPKGLYLQKNTLSTAGVKDTMYYRINVLNTKNLELTYLDRGNTLTFVKKKAVSSSRNTEMGSDASSSASSDQI